MEIGVRALRIVDVDVWKRSVLKIFFEDDADDIFLSVACSTGTPAGDLKKTTTTTTKAEKEEKTKKTSTSKRSRGSSTTLSSRECQEDQGEKTNSTRALDRPELLLSFGEMIAAHPSMTLND